MEKVNPDLVVRDKEGKPYTVRYDQVNAMLLNEFLKEHKKMEEQQARISELNTRVTKQETALAQQDCKIQEQEAIIAVQENGFESRLAEQEKQILALASGLQKVNAQVEMTKPAPQLVSNKQTDRRERR